MSMSYLKIGGELIGDAMLDLVVITQQLNRHWWCEVECRRPEDERFPLNRYSARTCRSLLLTNPAPSTSHLTGSF